MTDPIADMLTRIRNAYAVHKSDVVMPHSNLKEAVAGVLKDEGYITDFKVIAQEPQSQLHVSLKYVGNKPALTKVDRVSKPGRRVYAKANATKKVLSGHGVSIVSTSQGVMTDKQAKAANMGGEIICKVY